MPSNEASARIVLNRKNALFAGHDGAENWACIASHIETCKLHGVNLWPASRLDDLMLWTWAAEHSASRLAA
jgi:transposase